MLFCGVQQGSRPGPACRECTVCQVLDDRGRSVRHVTVRLHLNTLHASVCVHHRTPPTHGVWACNATYQHVRYM